MWTIKKTIRDNIFVYFYMMISTCADVKDMNKEKYISVADYYCGKSIFITGGTGFLGKMYIQKILYSCPGIEKIYMLLRASSIEAAKHRITQMVENSSQLFKKLKEERPFALLKLVPIVGDLSDENVGINPEDENLLREEVSIVVHSAATLNMHEFLQDALNINVTGTQNVLGVAKRMKKLQAFIHISTTFCAMTSDKEIIEEIVYPPPINLNDIKKLQEQYGHMRYPPKIILGDNRNTYTFTKAISESLILMSHGDLPTAIIRPSLIGSAHSEPYKGWLDVMNLHSFVMYAISNGQIRVLNIDRNTIWDFIPVDYVANLMILAATKCKRSNEVDVYNCASSFINPVKISNAISIFMSDFVNNKSSEYNNDNTNYVEIYLENCTQLQLFSGFYLDSKAVNAGVPDYYKMPFPFMLYLKSKILFDLITPILQSTPAHISDFSCLFTGQTPNTIQLYRKFLRYSKDITFYSSCPWKARSDRVISLLKTLSDEDKNIFPCDPSNIDWNEYFKKYSEGVRKFTHENYQKSKL